jgi:transcriptional regulator with XRE-family HTH domain
LDKFAARLNELRREKGITGEELAKIIGVNKATISRYENGVLTSPTLGVLKKLADYFDVSIDYIAGTSNIREKGITAAALSEIFRSLDDDRKKKLMSFANYLKAEQEGGINSDA